MFPKATIFSSLLLGVIAILWMASTCFVRQSDVDTFKKWADQKQEIRSSTESISSTAHQIRQGVRKDLWVAQEDQTRLHYRIESKSSLLTLVPEGNKVDMIENLEGIKCWVQDKLFSASQDQPMQQIRFFEADHGTYRYTSQQFIAQTVALSLLRLPGHELPSFIDPQSVFLRGIAQDVTFSLVGKNPLLQAHHFKASLNQNEITQ